MDDNKSPILFKNYTMNAYYIKFYTQVTNMIEVSSLLHESGD